jgi:hypothetical protein
MQTEKCQSGTGEWSEDEKLGMCICCVLLLLLLQSVWKKQTV